MIDKYTGWYKYRKYTYNTMYLESNLTTHSKDLIHSNDGSLVDIHKSINMKIT
jgi:hypothetical protein